jgi:diadenylate cyclase
VNSLDGQFSWVVSQFVTNPFFTLLDITLVALIIFWLLTIIQSTRAIQLVRGVIVLLILAAILGYTFQLSTLSWVIQNSIPALIIAIPVIFQPELRRALESLGRSSDLFSRSRELAHSPTMAAAITELVEAASELSRRHIGALVVLERRTGLQEYASRGTLLDAHVSRAALTNIFFPNAPLHDGAAIIRGGRIVAAGVVLPLSENTFGNHGTRHRAALGISEHSDAVVVVVSEESGTISMAVGGKMLTNLDAARLRTTLRGLFKLKSRASRHRRTLDEATRRETMAIDNSELALHPKGSADGKSG